jgi:hypothetical protein
LTVARSDIGFPNAQLKKIKMTPVAKHSATAKPPPGWSVALIISMNSANTTAKTPIPASNTRKNKKLIKRTIFIVINGLLFGESISAEATTKNNYLIWHLALAHLSSYMRFKPDSGALTTRT